MTFLKFPVARYGMEPIGDAISRACKEVSISHPSFKVVSIVPRILTYASSAPERFEVDEVDVIFQYDEQGAYRG